MKLYFVNRPELRAPFLATAAEVARGNPATVGIIEGWDGWEYPLRLLVRMRLGGAVQFEHVDARPESRDSRGEVAGQHGQPEKIVIIGSDVSETLPAGYRPAFVSDPIRVVERVNDPGTAGGTTEPWSRKGKQKLVPPSPAAEDRLRGQACPAYRRQAQVGLGWRVSERGGLRGKTQRACGHGAQPFEV